MCRIDQLRLVAIAAASGTRVYAARLHREYHKRDKRRHYIENSFGGIKTQRPARTSYDKVSPTYLDFVQLTSDKDWRTDRFCKHTLANAFFIPLPRL